MEGESQTIRDIADIVAQLPGSYGIEWPMRSSLKEFLHVQ